MKKQLLINQVLAILILIFLISIFSLYIHCFLPNTVAKAHIYRNCTSNEAAICQAIKDIENGKKYILMTGLLDIDNEKEKEMKKEEKDFDFKYISLGCVGGNRYCAVYHQIMRRAINQKANKMIFKTFDIYTLVEMNKSNNK